MGDAATLRASILIPTCDAGPLLDRVFEGIAGQQGAGDFEICVVDSESGDGTFERLHAWQDRLPFDLRIRRIRRVEFDHGETRNLLASMARGEFLVFLSQDAVPADPSFLANVLRNFDDDTVGAVYARQQHRAEASGTARALAKDDPVRSTQRRVSNWPDAGLASSLGPDAERVLCDFSNVASAVRRSLWVRHPFPRTGFGEDVLLARGLLRAGHRVVYEPAACVDHTHDDPIERVYARGFEDGVFNARWFGRICVEREADVETLVARAERDEPAKRADAVREKRRALFSGLYQGGQSVDPSMRRAEAATRMLESGSLRVLYVVHGYPPEANAGTEIYTRDLARAVRGRGHEVAVFARSACEADAPEEFAVSRRVEHGIPVYRVPHALAHRRLRESYCEPRVERAFEAVLEAFSPDVVHFQHLIHLSAGLVELAKRRGIPAVAHLHDYWALCPRVQMIRPDGVRCSSPQGLGCHACVHGGREDAIPRWASATAYAGPLLDGAARLTRRAARTTRLAERAGAYLDLRERNAYIAQALEACDLLITPSVFLRERMREAGSFDPARIAVSSNGLPRAAAGHATKKEPDPEGRLRVGFVGSVVEHKGLEVLLRAAKRLPAEAIRVLVFGPFDPDRDDDHARLARWAGPEVEFRGAFDRDRVAEVFSQIDVLVVPSLWFENSPTVIQEAFANRTPVVASDIGGMAERVRDGVDGLHFAVGSDASLAATLARLVSEPELADALAANAPEVRSIEEDAALHEARYRSLCTFAPSREPMPRVTEPRERRRALR